MLTMRPQPRSTMPGKVAFAMLKQPPRLMRITSFQSSKLIRARVPSRVMPALFTTMSIGPTRSEEHTSELQSLMRISYAVFCLKKKNNNTSDQSIDYNYQFANYYIQNRQSHQATNRDQIAT